MSKEKMSKARKYLIIGAIAVVVVGFLVIRANGDKFVADERLQLEITSPASRTSVTDAEITVTGIVSNAVAAVTVDGESVVVSADGSFSRPMALEYGSNRIVVEAAGEGLRPTTRSLIIPREMVLEVLGPVQDSLSSVESITVHGTVSDSEATIMVAGTDVAVAADGTWTMQFNLHYPLTVINVTARREGIEPITELVSVNFGPAPVISVR